MYSSQDSVHVFWNAIPYSYNTPNIFPILSKILGQLADPGEIMQSLLPIHKENLVCGWNVQ